MKFSYNWLKWYIPDAPSAQELHDVLTYHLTEVEGMENLPDGDVILDVNILPNRAHDLLSHKGLALEISGKLGLNFIEPKLKYDEILSKKEIAKTNLQIQSESNLCRRYSARIIRGIKVGPSPDWVVKHLESIGQRSINNIVDATNLLMYNCGQPAHAFDLRKFPDEKIIIKNAKDGDELELVGREKIVAKLKETDLTVTNTNGEILALVGVKGGANSGILDDTIDIVLEVGNFDPIAVRKTARRVGALSDAAKRFENDLTPELCFYGMLELTALISEMCPDAVIEEVVDHYPTTQEEKNISFTTSLVNKKLGGNISDSDIENILKNYKYEYNFDGSAFNITVPVFRLDLENPIDMVEEIGRIYGYDKLNPVMQTVNFSQKDNDTYTAIQNATMSLVNAGYKQVMTYTFTKKGDVSVARAPKGKEYLRTNLLDGLKESYELNKNNAPLLGVNEVKIFEIGTVFGTDKEEIHVAYVNKKEAKEFKLSQFTSPESTFEKSLDLLATLGQTFPKPLSGSASTLFSMWSQYPFITRDVSVWVSPNVTENDVLENIKNSINELVVVGPTLFDKFAKDNKNSYAFRLVFQAKDRTLVDSEVSEIMQKVESNLKNIPELVLR